MKRNNNRGSKPRKQNKDQRELVRNMSISHPPQLSSTVIRHSATLRFRATAAATTSITFQNLLDTYLTAASAVAGYDMFETVKVRRVRVWGMPAVGGTGSVSVEFSGVTAGLVGDQLLHTDTSMGVQPAHVDARPSAKSLASDYQVSSAAAAFRISVLAGSVVDVELSFRSTTPSAAGVAAQNALVGATIGSQYLRGLDGLATATSNYVPEFTAGQI